MKGNDSSKENKQREDLSANKIAVNGNACRGRRLSLMTMQDFSARTMTGNVLAVSFRPLQGNGLRAFLGDHGVPTTVRIMSA